MTAYEELQVALPQAGRANIGHGRVAHTTRFKTSPEKMPSCSTSTEIE